MNLYQIKVCGVIDQDWSDWFNGLKISTEIDRDAGYVTVFTGCVSDQAALRGILNHLWDLNLVVFAVNRVISIEEPEKE